MPTSHCPAAIASSSCVSFANTSVARFATQPRTTCSVFFSPCAAIIVATSDWL